MGALCQWHLWHYGCCSTVSCNALSTDSLDKDLYPVVTFDGTKLVNGYFEENCISSNNTKVESSSGKVRGNIRERFRIPREDPKSDPSEAMRKFSTLENMCYLNGLYVDIIPKNLSVVWSQIIGRPVTLPEKFAITSVTSQEMMKLRRQYMSDTYNRNIVKTRRTEYRTYQW